MGNQIREEDQIKKTLTENTYDTSGQLVGCKKTENGVVTLTQTNLYNGNGSRIRKEENGFITNYFYSQGNVLYTDDGKGNRTSLNLHGISGNVIATGRYADGKESRHYTGPRP